MTNIEDIEDIDICTEIINDEDNQITNNSLAQRAIFQTSTLWNQYSVITIGFLDDGNEIKYIEQCPEVDNNCDDDIEDAVSTLKVIDAIKLVVKKRIQPLVNLNLKFVSYNPANANVMISFDKTKGKWSTIGNDDEDQCRMNFSSFSGRTIMHEFCHLLGMRHEHLSEEIQWDIPKTLIYYQKTQGWDEKQVTENILYKLNKNDSTNSDFDPFSIMLYTVPKELTLNNVGFPKNNRLSPKDVIWITKTYPKRNEDPYTTAQNFYLTTYHESLEDSQKSLEELNSAFPWWKILLIVIGSLIGSLIGIILIGVLVKNMVESQKTKGYKSVKDREMKSQ